MKNTNETIIVEEVFETSVENVWHAITELEQMKQWFFDNIESFKPEIGFETQFNVKTGERNFLHLWKLTEVIPPEKIAYNWKYAGYEGNSFVTFELTEVNGTTKLKLTHDVEKSFPSNIPEFSRESCIDGWNHFITKRLKEYILRRFG